MANEKQLLQAVATLMRLDPLHEDGQLDEVGRSHLLSAREALLSQPPRVVLEAFSMWNRSGRLTIDPRPASVTDTGELASKAHGGGVRDSRVAVVLGGYRGAKD